VTLCPPGNRVLETRFIYRHSRLDLFFKSFRLKRWNFSKCRSTKHKHRSANTKHQTKFTPNNHLISRLKKKKKPKNPLDLREKEPIRLERKNPRT